MDQSVAVQNQTRLHQGSFFVKNLATLIKKTHFRNLVQSCTSSPSLEFKRKSLENVIESLLCYKCKAVPGPDEKQKNRLFALTTLVRYVKMQIKM